MSSDDRTPPKRVRITGLQEAQLQSVVAIARACSAMYYDAGFGPDDVPQRVAADFAKLARDHRVKVAEADHLEAGFIAWHDEAPGVAVVADLAVSPDYQRFGIGTKLLETVSEEARELGLSHVVARCWTRAGWALTFYLGRGFQVIDASAPPKVRDWAFSEEGTLKVRPGETALWFAIPTPPAEDEDTSDGDEPPYGDA